MMIIGVNIEKADTFIRCKADGPVELHEIYKHEKTGFYFQVTEIEVEDSTIVILKQCGKRRNRMITTTIALNMRLEPLELVTDMDTLEKIQNESCYC